MDKIKAGDYIFVAGYVGLFGTFQILERQEKKLLEHFSKTFIHGIQIKKEKLQEKSLPQIEELFKDAYIKELDNGGIYKALYEMSMGNKVGFDIDIFKIPILQETIEFCEIFRINPYQFDSKGSYLIISDPKDEDVRHLLESTLNMSLIGVITDNPDKIIRSKDEIKHLQRPVVNEIDKIM